MKTMKIIIDRVYKYPKYTVGEVYVNGNFYCYSMEDTDRGLHVDMPMRYMRERKIYGETAIPCGTYEVIIDYSPKFKKYMPHVLFRNDEDKLVEVPCFSGIRIHCLSPQTEILTEMGWQDYKSFCDNPAENCYSYNTETGKIEVMPINFLVHEQYNGKMYCNKGRRVNYTVTDKHKMWVAVKKHDGSFEWQWRTADNLTQDCKFITSAYKEEGWDITDEQLLVYKLIIAVQADGYIKNYSDSYSKVIFHFAKERKIERIKEYLNRLGDNFHEFVDSVGRTHITLSPKLSKHIAEMMCPTLSLYKEKELPIEILSLKSDVLKELVMDYLFWDGCYTHYLNNNHDIRISSTNERTIDILQAMATMCGMRTHKKLEPPKNNGHSNLWNLVLYNEQQVVKPQPDTFTTIDYDGDVWCLNNDNHTLIIRENGRTMVVGNCGNTDKDTLGCLMFGDWQGAATLVKSKPITSNLIDAIQKARNKMEKVILEIH